METISKKEGEGRYIYKTKVDVENNTQTYEEKIAWPFETQEECAIEMIKLNKKYREELLNQ